MRISDWSSDVCSSDLDSRHIDRLDKEKAGRALLRCPASGPVPPGRSVAPGSGNAEDPRLRIVDEEARRVGIRRTRREVEEGRLVVRGHDIPLVCPVPRQEPNLEATRPNIQPGVDGP